MELTYKTGGGEKNRKRGWKRITITGSTNDSEEERRIGSNEKAVVRLIRKDEIHSTNKPDFSWGREEGLEEVRHAWDYVRHSPRLYRASEYTVTDLIAFPATTSRIHFFFSLFLLNLFDFRIKVSKVYIYFRISFIYFRVKIFLFPDVVVGGHYSRSQLLGEIKPFYRGINSRIASLGANESFIPRD